MSQINFFVVKDTPSKLHRIVKAAQDHLRRQDPLIFLLPDAAALAYVDELLWKLPEDGFLPHPSRFITLELQPTQGGSSLFNLRPGAYLEKFSFKTIYEFEDHTSTEKLQLSKQRYQTYRDANYPIAFLDDTTSG